MSTGISVVCRVAIGLLLLLSACSSKSPRDQYFNTDAGSTIDLASDSDVAAVDVTTTDVTTTDDVAADAGTADDASDATSDTMDVDSSSAQDTAQTDADSEEIQ